MKKLIIFDFWGTIIENGVRPSPAKQVHYFLRVQYSFPEFIHVFEESFMTKKYENLKDAFESVTTAFNKHIPDFVYDKLIGMWNKFTILSKPFEETIEVLEDLSKDYELAILSNTDNFSLPQVLEKYELKKYFKYIHLSCETGKLKTDPTSFTDLLTETGLEKQDAIMIGDSPQSDIKGADAAGIDSVLIDRRAWYDGEKKISNLKELRAYIEALSTEENTTESLTTQTDENTSE